MMKMKVFRGLRQALTVGGGGHGPDVFRYGGVSWRSREKRLRRDEDVSPEQGCKSDKVAVVEVVSAGGRWRHWRLVVGDDGNSPEIGGRTKRCLVREKKRMKFCNSNFLILCFMFQM